MARSAGRPRNTDLDAAIRVSAETILSERGFHALSIDAVVSDAGTTRPAFYRRFPGITALLLDILLDRYGVALEFDTGTLEGDILAIQRDQVALFTDPLVEKSLAGFLEAVRHDEPLLTTFLVEFLAPRRHATIEIIRRAVARGEIQEPDDVDWVCDLLTGPLVMRTVLPRVGAVDELLAQQTTDSALSLLRKERPSPVSGS